MKMIKFDYQVKSWVYKDCTFVIKDGVFYYIPESFTRDNNFAFEYMRDHLGAHIIESAGFEIVTKEKFLEFYPHLKVLDNWRGDMGNERNYNFKKRLINWLYVELGYEYNSDAFTSYICNHWPNVCDESPKLLSFWPDQKAHDKGKNGRVKMKPGRAFRKMFPYFTDQEIQTLVDKFERYFEKSIWTVNEATDADSFEFAYYEGNYAPYKNLTTMGSMIKNSACSCMRHEFNQPVPPAKAYASGDFKIVYLTDQHGKVGARSVVRISNLRAGPIYAVSDSAVKSMGSHFKEQEIRFAQDNSESSGWVGASLQALPARQGGFYAPYLDILPQRLADCGESLVIDDSGVIDASDYGGILTNSSGPTCDDCGECTNDEEYTTLENEIICVHCIESGRYDYCNFNDMWTRNGVTGVYTTNWRGDIIFEEWADCELSGSATWISHRHEYWRDSDVMTDGNGNDFVQADLDDGEWQTCYFDGECYPCENMVETSDGEWWYEGNAKDEGLEPDNDGVWSRPESEESAA